MSPTTGTNASGGAAQEHRVYSVIMPCIVHRHQAAHDDRVTFRLAAIDDPPARTLLNSCRARGTRFYVPRRQDGQMAHRPDGVVEASETRSWLKRLR